MMLDITSILAPGMHAEVRRVVDIEDAYGNASSYLNQYLSTSACIDLAVKACMSITDSTLPEGYLSVGQRMELGHEVPVMLGTAVTVQAVLREVQGNKLIFDITGSDALGVVFRCVNERVVVNRIGLEEKGTARALEIQALKKRV
jgi:predicted thioesterase